MKTKIEDLIVCKNFSLVKKLGTGAFGQIYLAQSKINQSDMYAAKLEQAKTKFPQLHFQAKMYKYLGSNGPVVGLPKVYAMTTQGQYNIMLMDLLGKSLEDLFIQLNKSLSLRTVLQIGQQLIDRIEFLHQKQVIHRDIKPDNFLMGSGKNAHILYVVDFGLSKKYICQGKHIPYKDGKELTGTARYASINTHMGIEQSRRDDIQSIGYVLLYLLRGILPWQNMKAKDTKTKYKMIMQKKISTPSQVLCKGFPNQLAQFISYSRNLKFQEKPDYSYLKSLLSQARKKNKIQMDNVYDWTQAQNKTYLPIKVKSFNKLVSPEIKPTDKKIVPESKPDSAMFLKKNGNQIQQNHAQNLKSGKKLDNNAQKSNTAENLTNTKITGPKITVIKR